MNQLIRITAPSLPALFVATGERAEIRSLEFFAASIRNPNTRTCVPPKPISPLELVTGA